jgi:hypothetical protein
MEAIEMQQQFFNILKAALPSHISLVDELVEKLGVSYDSVYRRMRGEKLLNMAELQMLCKAYNISLDHVLDIKSNTVVFNAPDINIQNQSFLDYTKAMLGQLKYFNVMPGITMKYLCKDMTFFHFFLFPEMAAFKIFFWIKTIQNDPAFSRKRFSMADPEMEPYVEIGKLIVQEYNKTPSVELWNIESINSTISQISFYKDAGIFAGKEDLNCVIDSFETCINHIQLQLEIGLKFMPGATENQYKAPIKFYINEVVLGSNTILIESNDNRESWIAYNVLSYMVTKDPRFCAKAFSSFDTLLSKSTLISATGEKERNRLFFRFREKINALRDH